MRPSASTVFSFSRAFLISGAHYEIIIDIRDSQVVHFPSAQIYSLRHFSHGPLSL